MSLLNRGLVKLLWWKKFGLIREPKLDVHPLSIENANLFVSHQNREIQNKIFSRLEDPTLFFHKVYAIMGEYGSGKTTVVNYIRYYLHLSKVKCYNFSLEWKPFVPKVTGPHDVREWFIDEMRDGLTSAVEGAMPIEDCQDQLKVVSDILSRDKINEKQIISCITKLCKCYDGFTLFLDELHRLPHQEQIHVLDFLKLEQAFFQNACKSPVAIFIACLPEWKENLALPRYSGIFDDVVTLPTWRSADLGYELIDKRLRVAASDPVKFKNPFRRNALNKLARKPEVITPRAWIKQAKKIFENLPDGISEIARARCWTLWRKLELITLKVSNFLLSKTLTYFRIYLFCLVRNLETRNYIYACLI